jgi:hypothetical protein
MIGLGQARPSGHIGLDARMAGQDIEGRLALPPRASCPARIEEPSLSNTKAAS